jgi:hypothetical protein
MGGEKWGACFGFVNFSFTVIAAAPYKAKPTPPKSKAKKQRLDWAPKRTTDILSKSALVAGIRGAFVNAEPSCPRFLSKASDNLGELPLCPTVSLKG